MNLQSTTMDIYEDGGGTVEDALTMASKATRKNKLTSLPCSRPVNYCVREG
jgi:hypothetical protein